MIKGKLFILVLGIGMMTGAYGQTNTFPANGNVGIGTSSPSQLLTVSGGNLLVTGPYSEYISIQGGNTWPQLGIAADLNSAYQFIVGGSSTGLSWAGKLVFNYSNYKGNNPRMTIDSLGNVGIGTPNPQAPLHIVGTGVTLNDYQEYTGTMSIQANTGGRSDSTGAALEFVIPANTDGTNPWGQGRIMTVAGNSSSGYAVGKMILGTRRLANKFGIGNQWYYGNDITIDGSGNVGIGTVNPQSLLSVEGNITAQQLTVTQNNWSDFVFDSSYQRMPLDKVASYVSEHKHLPDIPSAAQIEQGGLDLGAMEKLQMQKIEELTLYAIDADKHAKQQDTLIEQLQMQLKIQQQAIEQLTEKIKGRP